MGAICPQDYAILWDKIGPSALKRSWDQSIDALSNKTHPSNYVV